MKRSDFGYDLEKKELQDKKFVLRELQTTKIEFETLCKYVLTNITKINILKRQHYLSQLSDLNFKIIRLQTLFDSLKSKKEFNGRASLNNTQYKL